MKGDGRKGLARPILVCGLAREGVDLAEVGRLEAALERLAPHPKEAATTMNLRHAAALALVGWYMMIPPTSRDYPMGNVSAPLSQWIIRPTIYRNKEECEHVLDRQTRLRNARNRQIQVRFFRQWQCIASDDPRLTE